MTYSRIPYVELQCDHPAVLSDDNLAPGSSPHSTRCAETIRVSIPPLADDGDRPIEYARETVAKYHGWSTEPIEGTNGWHPANRHDFCREHTMLAAEGQARAEAGQ